MGSQPDKCDAVVLYNKQRLYATPCQQLILDDGSAISIRVPPDAAIGCVQECIRVHEAVHVQQCADKKPFDEKPADEAGYECFKNKCLAAGCRGVGVNCDPYPLSQR